MTKPKTHTFKIIVYLIPYWHFWNKLVRMAIYSKDYYERNKVNIYTTAQNIFEVSSVHQGRNHLIKTVILWNITII